MRKLVTLSAITAALLMSGCTSNNPLAPQSSTGGNLVLDKPPAEPVPPVVSHLTATGSTMDTLR